MPASASTGQDYDVVIAGGGFAGLALGAILRQSLGGSIRVAILDPVFTRPGPPDPNASAIAPGPRRLLEAIGVWDRLAEVAGPVAGMAITDARLEDILRPVWLDFTAPADGSDPIAHIVPNEALKAVLRDAARQAGVHLLAEGFVSFAHGAGGLQVELSGGGMVRTSLLVAADGVRSRVRSAARIRTHGWRYGQSAIVVTVKLVEDHGGIATQHFLPGGPLALLPLPGSRAAVVWTLPGVEAERIMALADEAFLDALAIAAGQPFAGLENDRAVRPLGLQIARRFVGERIALIGDAAHAVHPLAGQGLNLALKDVAALAEVLAETARLGGDPGNGQMLERYARWRRFDSLAMLAATEALARLFKGDRLRMVRDIGLGAFDRSGLLKRAVTGAASGSSRHAPRLLRGEVL